MIAITTKEDRIVINTEQGREEYTYQHIEDDLGGGKRWTDEPWENLEQIAFGFTHGWKNLFPLWPTPFLQDANRFRQPTNDQDILKFEVTPMGRYIDGHCRAYLVAFGAWKHLNGTTWEHRSSGNGGIWVAKKINSRLFGEIIEMLDPEKNQEEMIQVLLKLRVQLNDKSLAHED